MERKNTRGPGAETKGGGFHGGPKRWTGRGPAPARHIPWPEIFKHHISVVEGHLKMIDMVRKHTVEGSGNWRMICELVDRTNEMLRVSKQQARTFVAPPGQREQVPLGSSSASMYPGYSPADHEYGKAAEEFGRVAAEARAMGVEIKHPEVEYKIGQAKGNKRRTLAAMRRESAAKAQGSGSGSGSGSEGPTVQVLEEKEKLLKKAKDEKAKAPTPEGDNPFFIIDTKPTPVNLPGITTQPVKRSASPPGSTEAKKHKKAEKHHEGELSKSEDAAKVEFEDISGEVDARMKEKEEKRKRKEEKKRKRESEGDQTEAAEAHATSSDTPAAGIEVEKPKTKKAKKSNREELADRTASNKRSGEEIEEATGKEGKKTKKRKKGNSALEEV